MSLTQDYQLARSEMQCDVELVEGQLEWAVLGTDFRAVIVSEHKAFVESLVAAEEIILKTNKFCSRIVSVVESRAQSFIDYYQSDKVNLKKIVNEAFCSIAAPATADMEGDPNRRKILESAVAASAEIFKIQTGVKPKIVAPI